MAGLPSPQSSPSNPPPVLLAHLRAVTGSGWRSSSSVGGGYFSAAQQAQHEWLTSTASGVSSQRACVDPPGQVKRAKQRPAHGPPQTHLVG